MERKLAVMVKVTQQDIDTGCRADAENCPIYRAIDRLQVLKPHIHIDGTAVRRHAQYDGSLVAYDKVAAELPGEAREWIAVYDFHGAENLDPIEFPLYIPVEHLRPELVFGDHINWRFPFA